VVQRTMLSLTYRETMLPALREVHQTLLETHQALPQAPRPPMLEKTVLKTHLVQMEMLLESVPSSQHIRSADSSKLETHHADLFRRNEGDDDIENLKTV
jgi:hypothetical protein